MKYSVMIFLLIGLTYRPILFGQVPANDECAGSTVISALPDSFSQNTRLATPNIGDPVLSCADGGGGKTVWFVYTADSTGYVKFSTAQSTPATYDIALGLFRGECGSLEMLDCTDDIVPGTVRQAEILYWVQKDSTYILHVAEWNGGGPEGGIPTGGDLVLKVFYSTPDPLIREPKTGSVSSGAAASTDNFGIILSKGSGGTREAEKLPEVPRRPTPADVMEPLAPQGSNYHEETGAVSGVSTISRPVVLKSYQGFSFTGAIPPDPVLAVGPNHIVGMVNSSFRIWDKEGTLLKNISLDNWFSNVASPVGFADPKVIYDHYAGRWVMTGGGFAEPYNILISVSDDDNPLGTWYNWALPASLGDSTTGNLPDYPTLGFDDQAVYITTREFNPGFLYSRLRIIGTSQLYENSAGPVTWIDIWDFREPDHRSVPLDGIQPTITYDAPGVEFLVNDSPYSEGTFFTVWSITNPLTAPSVSALNVPVVEYGQAPNPGQLGGGTPIEGGTSRVRASAVYRDSSLWAVHSIASGTGNAYSAVRYVRLNPHTNTNLEDVAMGAEGYWHFYTALMVDAEENIIVTYSRSGVTEYAGAYLAGRKNSDPPGLSPSTILMPGAGNYDLVGGGRNRWGDYNGVGLDPVDTLAVWINTEFATGSNVWNTWVGMAKMGPLPGAYINTDKTLLSFREAEVGQPSDTLSFTLVNNGIDTLIISGVDEPDSHFVLINKPVFPVKLATYETFEFTAVCIPESHGDLHRQFIVHNNDLNNPAYPIEVAGKGFVITPASAGIMYMSLSDGDIAGINISDGSFSVIGSSGYGSIVASRVHPSTHLLFGLASSGTGTPLVRINSAGGDAHQLSNIPQQWLKGMAFRLDTLYVGYPSGALFRVDVQTGSMVQIASTGLNITGLDFNPISGDLWASGTKTGAVDWVYKINLPSGTASAVGSTGFGAKVNDIVFDVNGKLFGIVSYSFDPSDIIMIDTATGKGYKLWSPGQSLRSISLDRSASIPVSLWAYDLAPRWNLISLPVQVDDNRRESLFPTASSEAIIYKEEYLTDDSLFTGTGYWLKFPAAVSSGIAGFPISSDTIDVVGGWNLIGSISEPIAVSSVTSEPPGITTSEFFDYSGSYQTTDTIFPGKGYWVKVGQPGSLILSVDNIYVQADRIRIVSSYDIPPQPPDEPVVVQNLPVNYALGQNYPNPFNPTTVITYQLPIQSHVRLEVFNILGQRAALLADGEESPGFKSVIFDASGLTSGVYYYRIQAGTFTETRKLVMLR